ncbi:CQI_4a_G0003500.mRNA.1.CDS.1 [Saccharomyces cerevisiae]|nr:CQI_4a_G0003500.mRNA.1.CDS.1 [Saccharomyces cerevisiae]CAI7151466.1 CQI_4a_G0003500.mRNA.1.CDS.1 [Saccharomyces cerevisiae]
MNMDSGITSSHGSMDKTQKQSSEWAANQKHNQRVENTRVLMGPAVPAMPPVPSNFPPVPTGTIMSPQLSPFPDHRLRHHPLAHMMPADKNFLAYNMESFKSRVTKACDYCRKRKIRCTEIEPISGKCRNCIKYNKDCTFHFHEELKRRREEALNNKGNGKSVKKPRLDKENKFKDENFDIAVRSRNTSSTDSSPKLHTNLSQEYIGVSAGKSASDKEDTWPDFVPIDRTVLEKIELNHTKVAGKVFVLEEICKNMKGTIEKLAEKSKIDVIDKEYMKRPKRKQYSKALLTKQKMFHFRQNVLSHLTDEEFLSPIDEMFTTTFKYSILQTKLVLDFSFRSASSPSSDNILYPLPRLAIAKRLLKNIKCPSLASLLHIVDVDQCLQFADVHFDPAKGRLTPSQAFLLNICLCLGATVTNFEEKQELVDEDNHETYYFEKFELWRLRSFTFLNSVYYYHKLSVARADMTALKALLLLAKFAQQKISASSAVKVLSVAIKVALDLRLNLHSTYEDLELDEIIKRRRLWCYCFSTDKFFSVVLSRPPFLKEENTDVLTDESYVELFRDKILPNLSIKYDDSKLEGVKDIVSVVNLLANHLEYVPYIQSYFLSRLSLIESQIYYSCFSIRTTLDDTLDEIIENVLENKKALDRMRDDLPTILSLENYKENMRILSLESSKLDFEVSCCTTILLHLRWYHQKITLSLFVISIIGDNLDQRESSRHDIAEIIRRSRLDFKRNCIEVLNILKDFEYYPTVQNEFLYFSLTTVFSMFLYLSEIMVNDEHAMETGYIIGLLRDTHTRMLGSEERCLSVHNLKWQTSLFFYTFFLRSTMEKFNLTSKYAKFYAFDSNYYEGVLNRLVKHTRESKDDMVELLKTSFINKEKMAAFGSFVTEDQEKMEVSFNIFNEITIQDLNFLQFSSIPKLWENKTLEPGEEYHHSNGTNTDNNETTGADDTDDNNNNNNNNGNNSSSTTNNNNNNYGNSNNNDNDNNINDDDDDDDDNDDDYSNNGADDDEEDDDYDRSLFPTGLASLLDTSYPERTANDYRDENEQSNKLFEKIEGHLEHGVFFYDRDFFFKNVCVKM